MRISLYTYAMIGAFCIKFRPRKRRKKSFREGGRGRAGSSSRNRRYSWRFTNHYRPSDAGMLQCAGVWCSTTPEVKKACV